MRLHRQRRLQLNKARKHTRAVVALLVGVTAIPFAPSPFAPSRAVAASTGVPQAGQVLPSLPDSATLNTAALASGTIRDANGAPLGDSDVVLRAWPSNSELARLTVGAQVKVTPIARTVSDSSGKFVLREPASGVDSSVVNPEGILNLDIVATKGDRWTSFSFSRRRYGQVWRGSVGDNGGQLGDTPGSSPQVDISLDRRRSSDGAAARKSETEAPVAAPRGCSSALVGEYHNTHVALAQTSVTSRAHARVTYTYGNSSSLGVGFSTSGQYGSFSSNGTTSQSNSSTVEFGSFDRAGIGAQIVTGWDYGSFVSTCVDYSTGWTTTWYDFRPIRFDGGNYSYTTGQWNVGGYSANRCNPYGPNDVFTRSSSTNVTWTDGVASAPIIGVNLQSTSGWTSAMNVTYRFTGNAWLCGNNGTPPSSALIAQIDR